MKKLVLFSLLSLCSSAFALKLAVDLDMDGYKIQTSAVLENDSHVWRCQSGDIKMMAHIDSEDEYVVMDFEIHKKNGNGNFELVSEPHIKTEWGKEAVIKIENKNQDSSMTLHATASK